ncbi:MAG: M55 family metallopeptidase [Planctomycetes bacterium]|nr:M55 family metallopeptidase [Planctomycetota bacterium]
MARKKENRVERIYIMTDLEGVAGVLNFDDWCHPESRYYDLAKEFLTNEVNAAVDGFFHGGAKEIVVADGHGPGALNPDLLDPRAELMRGWGRGWPFNLDEGWDAIAWVGQHAKARTEFAHLAHTQGMNYLNLSINGVAIGEFGQLALCASQLGVRVIFGSGDLAFTKEAQALAPGIETVAVKRGTSPGAGDDLDADAYRKKNVPAIHKQPKRAREMIREGAVRAVARAGREDFGIVPLKPPYRRVAVFRQTADQPRTYSIETHPKDVIALIAMPYKRKPVESEKQLKELLRGRET